MCQAYVKTKEGRKQKVWFFNLYGKVEPSPMIEGYWSNYNSSEYLIARRIII
jgi:hypothetical protein